MLTKNEDRDFKYPLVGVKYKTLAFGEKTSLSEFHLDKGSTIPPHKHPHEQTGYMVSGRMTFTIAGKQFDTRSGDRWNIPGDVEHGVEVHEDSIVVEVFSPLREDYLP